MTRSVGKEQERAEIARVGLCITCAFSQLQESAKATGNRFYRCKRADEDDGYMKYPPIPVIGCRGFAANAPAD